MSKRPNRSLKEVLGYPVSRDLRSVRVRHKTPDPGACEDAEPPRRVVDPLGEVRWNPIQEVPVSIRARFLVWLLTLASLAGSGGCGGAQNSPEEALAAVRTAFQEERWDLLYDVLPPARQEAFRAQLAENDERIAQLERQVGPERADEMLQADFGFTRAEWRAMEPRARFAAVFGRDARMELAQSGINLQYVAESELRSVEIAGENATIVVDDGRGHRTKLRFILVDGAWRFDLGEEP